MQDTYEHFTSDEMRHANRVARAMNLRSWKEVQREWNKKHPDQKLAPQTLRIIANKAMRKIRAAMEDTSYEDWM